MSGIRKFAFDTEFAADGAIVAAAAKKLTAEDLEVERAKAYELGASDAHARAERDAAAAMRALADAAAAIVQRLDAEAKAMREEAAHLAIVAARKIAGAALDAYGGERIAAAVEAVMDMLRHQPRLIVKLSPEACEQLGPRIAAMCDTHGYSGAILLRPQQGLSAGEVAIDWSDGVIALDPGEAAKRIEALIQSALASPMSEKIP